MSRNKDAVRLAELKGISYSAALNLIRNGLSAAEGESQHAVAMRLIEAEEARLRNLPLAEAPQPSSSASGPAYTGLFQEPNNR